MKTKDVATNLQILRPSKKQPKEGDIFVCKPKGHEYYFGRVIATDALIGTMKNCILLYIFSVQSEEKTPPNRLSAMQLLIPPLMTNRLPWSRGYFETVANRSFEPGERLPVHCFREPGRMPERYWDEYNNELHFKREPCGYHALDSFRTIDDAISEKLGIPLASDLP